jgi:hypothetical protein
MILKLNILTKLKLVRLNGLCLSNVQALNPEMDLCLLTKAEFRISGQRLK